MTYYFPDSPPPPPPSKFPEVLGVVAVVALIVFAIVGTFWPA